MAKKVTITLDEDILAFIDKRGANNGETPNRSGYINDVLSQHRRTVLEAEMIAALQEDANDPEYQKEIALWDCVAGDGIE
ncbi:CopG family transcriptional regulator [Halotia wernerae UHCC 0503]|nr:CopG family transcriptional regulator [Halotia wernerae UHCC 0503]